MAVSKKFPSPVNERVVVLNRWRYINALKRVIDEVADDEDVNHEDVSALEALLKDLQKA